MNAMPFHIIINVNNFQVQHFVVAVDLVRAIAVQMYNGKYMKCVEHVLYSQTQKV